MRHLRPILITLTLTALFVGFGTSAVLAQNPPSYQPLVGIPGVDGSGSGNLANYFNKLYIFAVALGAMLAVIKISIAGVKYSLSDVVTNKGEAKEDIKGALLGLIILLIPAIVLNTIYGGLTNLNILERSFPPINLRDSVHNAGSSAQPIPSQSQVRAVDNAAAGGGAPPTAASDPQNLAAQRRSACTAKASEGWIWDGISCVPPTAASLPGSQTYQRSELSSDLNARWTAKCGAGKLRTTSHSDGSRTYACAP